MTYLQYFHKIFLKLLPPPSILICLLIMKRYICKLFIRKTTSNQELESQRNSFSVKKFTQKSFANIVGEINLVECFSPSLQIQMNKKMLGPIH
jgi:hypothetical protein